MPRCLLRTHLDALRTTLTLDDQVLRQLRAKAASSGKPFKAVVDEALRAGLAAPVPRSRPAYVCPAFAMGLPQGAIDFSKALQLAGELEDQARFEKLEQGR